MSIVVILVILGVILGLLVLGGWAARERQEAQTPTLRHAWRRFAVRMAHREALSEHRRVTRRAFERLADAAGDQRQMFVEPRRGTSERFHRNRDTG